MSKVDIFRANWKTAIIAGALLALTAYTNEQMLAIVFFPLMFWGVVGVRQAIEHHRDLRKRKLLFEIYSSDFRKYHLPVGGRMLIWFISTAVATVTLQLIGYDL